MVLWTGGEIFIPGLDFSATEQDTGQLWTDAKAVFQKTISLGTLPNGPVLDTKNVAHGIAAIDTVVHQRVAAAQNATPFYIPLPRSAKSASNNLELDVFLDATNIIISTANDYSGYTGFLTLWYTKP